MEGRIFKGDDRNVGEPGSYRTTQIITIETDPTKGPALASEYHGDGTTQELNSDGSERGSPAQGSGNSLELAVTRDDSGVNVHVKGNESDPLVTGAPGITYDLNVKVQSNGTQGNAVVTVSGSHDKFPAYEIYATRQELPKPTTTVVYGYDPRPAGRTARSLIPFPGNSTTVNRTTVIPGQSPPPTPPPRRRRGKRGEEDE